MRGTRRRKFVRACNRGAQAAEGDYIVFLNNDTSRPHAGWMSCSMLRKLRWCGLAGAKLLYPNGVLQEPAGSSGPTAIRELRPQPERRGSEYSIRASGLRFGRRTDDSAPSLHDVGVQEEFAPAYFEDTDLAFKCEHAD